MGRSAERRLQSYVDHNSSGCYSVYAARAPPRSTGTLQYRLPNLRQFCLSWDVNQNPNQALLLPVGIHLTLHTPRASGYVQTTLAGLLLPSCLIVVSLLRLCVKQRHSYRCGLCEAVFKSTVYTVTSSNYYKSLVLELLCTDTVVI